MQNNISPSRGLVLSAIGVVFGDIGTSPLYTLRECLKAAGGASSHSVLGILSLILWSITLVVTLKYVAFVMRADNEGEGGILALTALATKHAPQRWRNTLLMMGLFGAAMFYGDSMITPAISVISAVEGLELITPAFSPWVVVISLVILTGLFGIQRHGTATIGRLFGPVMVVWFLTLAALGIYHIVANPGVLRAISPLFAMRFIAHNPVTAFIVLGSVFLALTGGEALYADMGHFGKDPIRRAWLLIVFPSLILNYFGQGALVLVRPETIVQPFFNTAPGWALVPLVLLSGLATVIASQAVISGAFSMTKQAVQLGFLPRVNVIHTSMEESGQVFVPFINGSLFVAVAFLVLFFRSSSNLAAAYGIAVASTMLLTTTLMSFVCLFRWQWKPVTTFAVIVPLAIVDGLFVASNSSKIVEGGWFPILAGIGLYTIMTTWRRGRGLVIESIKADNQPLREFIQILCGGEHSPDRVSGTAVFPSGLPGVTPAAFMHNLKHNRILHTVNIFIASVTQGVPYVPEHERLAVEDLGYGCYQVTARHGFMEIPNVPGLLARLDKKLGGWVYEPMDTSFFVTRDKILARGKSGNMAKWREKLFAFLSQNAAEAAEFYSLPGNRVVELGTQINL